MNNVALTYKTLGRHADALAMGQRVLEFRRRVLPENHPSIGERSVWSFSRNIFILRCAGVAMDNLAMTYYALQMFSDALAMGEKALEFFCRVLPENHPSIGKCDPLSNSCS